MQRSVVSTPLGTEFGVLGLTPQDRNLVIKLTIQAICKTSKQCTCNYCVKQN